MDFPGVEGSCLIRGFISYLARFQQLAGSLRKTHLATGGLMLLDKLKVSQAFVTLSQAFRRGVAPSRTVRGCPISKVRPLSVLIGGFYKVCLEAFISKVYCWVEKATLAMGKDIGQCLTVDGLD